MEEHILRREKEKNTLSLLFVLWWQDFDFIYVDLVQHNSFFFYLKL